MFKKESILSIQNVYTSHSFALQSGVYIGAGSETENQVYLYDLGNRTSEQVMDCPGGMMSFIPVPGKEDTFVTIMGLFPPFIGKEAGLFLHQRNGGGRLQTVKAMDLPFAHRCEILTRNGVNYLFAATVSKHKDEPADWSRPGELHLIILDQPGQHPWQSTVIDNQLIRNHGMLKASINGMETLCISGMQGIFYLEQGGNGSWKLVRLFDKEVSELALMDLDGDGSDELITIEPFHGTTLNVYKQSGSGWDQVFSDTLSFGHGLSAGLITGEPMIAVGNRDDSLSLDVFRVQDLQNGNIERLSIEEGVGPTQTEFIAHGGKDYLMSANQKKHEVALYAPA